MDLPCPRCEFTPVQGRDAETGRCVDKAACTRRLKTRRSLPTLKGPSHNDLLSAYAQAPKMGAAR